MFTGQYSSWQGRRAPLEAHRLSARPGGPSTPGFKTSAFQPGRMALPAAVWFHFLEEAWFGF